jgi:hypothetical protein
VDVKKVHPDARQLLGIDKTWPEVFKHKDIYTDSDVKSEYRWNVDGQAVQGKKRTHKKKAKDKSFELEIAELRTKAKEAHACASKILKRKEPANQVKFELVVVKLTEVIKQLKGV